MKKTVSILVLIIFFGLLFACGEHENPSDTEGDISSSVDSGDTISEEDEPPVAESMRGTVSDGKLYLADGYATISVFDGWSLQMVYEYSTKLINLENDDSLTIVILHDPENNDKFEENTRELKEEIFADVFEQTELLSFEKSENDGIKKTIAVCVVTEDEVSYTVYEYKIFINTDIYTLTYYIYSDELTSETVNENAATFEYLGNID